MEARAEQVWCSQCTALELWPENRPAVALWQAVRTQIQYAGLDGQPTGLNYAGVEAAMRLRHDDPALFADVQVLEAAFLTIAYEKAAKPPANPPTKPPRR